MKTTTKRVSKSGQIKKYLKNHPEAKPLEVVEALKKVKVTVTAGLVSGVKNQMKKKEEAGLSPTEDGRKSRITSLSAKKKAMQGNGVVVTMAELIEAKQMSIRLGGIDRTVSLMNDLKQLQAIEG